MNIKKLILYLTIGVISSAIFFGSIIYFVFIRNADADSRPVKTYEYNIGDFTTNLGTVRNFFKGNIVVEVTDRSLIDEFEENDAKIRDKVIKTLIDKRPEDIIESEGKQQLREELITEISKVLQTEEITNLYFIDYIIQ